MARGHITRRSIEITISPLLLTLPHHHCIKATARAAEMLASARLAEERATEAAAKGRLAEDAMRTAGEEVRRKLWEGVRT